jgi:acetolactate decarboxylase
MNSVMMRTINSKISNSLWHAIERRHVRTGESIPHILSRALADYLEVDHNTLFQVSTTGALVEGLYQGEVTVGELKRHGDFGLGTFNNLDGEMIVLDGKFFHAGPDGEVNEVHNDVLSPFAVVTHFVPEKSVEVADCANMATLLSTVDNLRNSDNIFFAVRVDGEFETVRTRVACKQEEGVRLLNATATQAEFKYENIEGSLIGFWTPEYVKTLNVPGYHFHFLTKDQRFGGHLLECSAKSLQVRIQHEGNFRMSLPETSAFLKADFSRDTSGELLQAEK